MQEKLFQEELRKTPKIYAYKDDSFPGQLKIGYTTQDIVDNRLKQQHAINEPWKTYHLEWADSAFYADDDGSSFSDKHIHKMLKENGFEQTATEWFKCSLKDVKSAYIAVKNKTQMQKNRDCDFGMREEQEKAVQETFGYFNSINERNKTASKKVTPKFLWNAKMHFGKTFTTYCLAKKMNFKKVLVLTFKPAVEESWKEDLQSHIYFEGWQFYSRNSLIKPENLDSSKPIVCFGSFQDYLGTSNDGSIKAKNEWVHSTQWDLIVLDEYHFGAWNENSKNLLDIGTDADKKEIEEQNEILRQDGFDTKSATKFDIDLMPITGNHYLFLSGTPFRAISSGEFLEEQIFNWTYQDEQELKEKYENENPQNNPYAELPKMIMMTYQMPDDLGLQTEQYDMKEFNLNDFFEAEGSGRDARFIHEKAVQKWLDIIRGKVPIYNSDSPLNEAPPLPFDDSRLLNMCNHTMWFLYSVASCDAMEELLSRPANNFYHSYKIINCSGVEAGTGKDALPPVRKAMGENPNLTKTIILTCGKLTTGVTIKPLTGIFMLRNCSSPETYFQSAFRVQSPWSIRDENDVNKKIILKETCYVFDFAPNRTLRQLVEYANKLGSNKPDKNGKYQTATQKVEDFTKFLPVLQFDGCSMKRVNATEILDFVDSGTTATLLARRWNSATLVNVDNSTLERILANPKAFEAIMKIEGFRKLGSDIIQTVVNKSQKIKDMKKKSSENTPTQEEKKILSEEEKEYKSKRKLIQEKLMKFATRIPIFMYLTDYREEALTDIIRKLEPKLFERVTGLTIEDFEMLVSVGVFNSSQMNDAILKFHRYEDSSLSYTGIDSHKDDKSIGAFDTAVSRENYVIKRA